MFWFQLEYYQIRLIWVRVYDTRGYQTIKLPVTACRNPYLFLPFLTTTYYQRTNSQLDKLTMSAKGRTIPTRILTWLRTDEQSHLITNPSSEYAYLPLAESPSSPTSRRNTLHSSFPDLTHDEPLPNSPPPDISLIDSDEQGVAKIEALHRVFGKGALSTRWLYASIGAVSYIYSLDQNTTSNYLPLATSAFNMHSMIGTISTAESIISE